MVKEDAEFMQKRIMESKFDFNDFLSQTRNLARMGSMSSVMKFIPGMNKVLLLLISITMMSIRSRDLPTYEGLTNVGCRMLHWSLFSAVSISWILFYLLIILFTYRLDHSLLNLHLLES